jgi:4-hydroxybenzoate polyprenyltransferase
MAAMTPAVRLAAFVRLIHPFPVGVVLLTSAGLLVVALGAVPGPGLLTRTMTVVLLSQIAVGALNDYTDRHRDARLQPDKPIPSGLVSAPEALLLAAAASLTVPLAAASFGPLSVAIASLGTAAGLTYDLWLKQTRFSFLAYIVAFLCLVTWIWLIAGRLTTVFFAIYPAGACLLTAAHLANAFPDIEIDASLGSGGLGAALGPRRSMIAILTLYGLVAISTALLAVVAGSGLALIFTVAGSAMAMLGGVAGFAALDRRPIRKLVFRLVAPAIGLLALAAFVALSHWA